MILLPEFYWEKKICVLGSGASLSKYSINWSDYDCVVGINRIYQTSYFPHINVLYTCTSNKDWHNLSLLLESLNTRDNFKFIVFCPWIKDTIKKRTIIEEATKRNVYDKIMFSQNIVKEITFDYLLHNNNTINTFLMIDKKEVQYKNLYLYKGIRKRPLTGLSCLHHICASGAAHIDVFGFDFYANRQYVENLRYYGHQMHDTADNRNFLLHLQEIYQNIRLYN